ncbi:MAG: transposase [Candidatus Aminicenantales bacterium]
MPRIARVVIPGCPHHVIQRGNRRLRVFFSEADKATYLTLLKRQIDKHGLRIWAYCLMDNHVHLVAVPGTKDSLSKAISETHRKYTSLINIREDWKGYLWQGRFVSYPLDDGYCYSVIRYIERNPVRARIVSKAEDYRWSSARSHIEKSVNRLLSPCPLEPTIGDWLDYLRQMDREEDIQVIGEHEHTGRPLGSDDFVRKLEQLTGRTLLPLKKGRKKTRKSEISIVSPN